MHMMVVPPSLPPVPRPVVKTWARRAAAAGVGPSSCSGTSCTGPVCSAAQPWRSAWTRARNTWQRPVSICRCRAPPSVTATRCLGRGPKQHPSATARWAVHTIVSWLTVWKGHPGPRAPGQRPTSTTATVDRPFLAKRNLKSVAISRPDDNGLFKSVAGPSEDGGGETCFRFRLRYTHSLTALTPCFFNAICRNAIQFKMYDISIISQTVGEIHTNARDDTIKNVRAQGL